MSYFRSGKADSNRPAREFIHFNAFGKAILLAHEDPKVRAFLQKEAIPQPRRSVVLIDEIDKAPRDFPNDILNELERLSFQIPELSEQLQDLPALEIQKDSACAPIVILTSNSENQLPDPFLRRCIYYDLPFPKAETLAEILERRLGIDSHAAFSKSALEFFHELRGGRRAMEKRPSTSELLCWLFVLHNLAGVDLERDCLHSAEQVAQSLSVLAKTSADQKWVHEQWHAWQEARKRA